MTQDETIKLARECLILPSTITDDNGTGMYATFQVYKASIEALQRFAAIVAANEREACAKVCGQLMTPWDENTLNGELIALRNDGMRQCAAAIRARNNKE